MEKINVIIPCCGEGRRFLDAGYKQYKPSLKYNGKPLLHHVIDAFPKEALIWIITDEKHSDLLKDLLKDLLVNYPNIHWIYIEAHKNGPAWSINSASHQLPQHQPCFVAYNNVWWKWNFDEVARFIDTFKTDGIVFTHTGFHPHLYNNNFSAFCQVSGRQVTAVKEKGSFTDDWMNEPLSTGVYFFADSCMLFSLINTMISNENRVAGEFYPSVVFNDMISLGKTIFTYETKPFLHLGTPEQYEDALAWSNIITAQNKLHEIPVMIMMCGTGSRMKSLARVNKAGIDVNKMPMFRFVAAKMASSNNLFLVNKHTLKLLTDNDTYINIGEQTETQSESLKKAQPFITGNQGLLVCSNDCYGFFDSDLLRSFADFDMVLFGFNLRLMHRKQADTHTGFKVKEPDVVEIRYKNALQADYGFAGMCYFPNTRILSELNTMDCLQNSSIDNFAAHLLKNKFKIGYIILKDYVHLGTPEEFQEFLFWSNLYYD